MKHIGSFIFLAALLTALPAQAKSPTYSYLDFDYLSSEFKPDPAAPETKSNGGRLGVNISLERWVYFTGEYNHFDFENSSAQERNTSLGFGGHTPDYHNIYGFAAGTYERATHFGGGAFPNSTDEGFGLQAGVRLPFLDLYEVQADYKWMSVGKDSSGADLKSSRYRLTAQARLSDVWAFVGSYQLLKTDAGDQKDWTAGFRAYFNTQYDVPARRKPDASSGN